MQLFRGASFCFHNLILINARLTFLVAEKAIAIVDLLKCFERRKNTPKTEDYKHTLDLLTFKEVDPFFCQSAECCQIF